MPIKLNQISHLGKQIVERSISKDYTELTYTGSVGEGHDLTLIDTIPANSLILSLFFDVTEGLNDDSPWGEVTLLPKLFNSGSQNENDSYIATILSSGGVGCAFVAAEVSDFGYSSGDKAFCYGNSAASNLYIPYANVSAVTGDVCIAISGVGSTLTAGHINIKYSYVEI